MTWAAGGVSGRLSPSSKKSGQDLSSFDFSFSRAEVGGKVFERNVEKDCERVHSNIDYNVDKNGAFKVMQRN